MDSEKMDSNGENNGKDFKGENMVSEEICKTDTETLENKTDNTVKVEIKASKTSPSLQSLARKPLHSHQTEKDPSAIEAKSFLKESPVILKKSLPSSPTTNRQKFIPPSPKDLKKKEKEKANLYPKITEIKEFTDIDPANNISRSFFNWNKWLILLAIIIALMIGKYSGSSNVVTIPPNVTDLNSLIENLKTNFTHQPKSNWKMISTAMKNVWNNTEPKAPAILLFLAAKNAEKVASCLSIKLAESFSNLGFGENFSLIESSRFANLDSDRAKEELELEIIHGYDMNRRIFIITHLDDINGKAAMMLHSFCDDQNAPYKQVVYMMIVHYNSEIENISTTYETETEELLKKAWKIEDDQFQPLFNRISVNILPIFSENKNTCL